MATKEINIRSVIMDGPATDPKPVQITESRLIDIKDDYLSLLSDTHCEITRNHEKPGHRMAPERRSPDKATSKGHHSARLARITTKIARRAQVPDCGHVRGFTAPAARRPRPQCRIAANSA